MGDNIDKSSQKLGVSAEFYQEWDAVLQHSGTSMDNMTATFKKLATTSQDATKDQEAAYQALGLSMDQVKSMSAEDLFTNVISGLQNMEDGTQRTAIATELLGKGAMEMGALLNTSSAETQQMIQDVHDLGGVMSDEAVQSAAAFQDSLQNMQTAFAGVKNSVMADMLPSFTAVLDGLSGLMTGSDDASAKLKEGVQGVVTNVTEAMPQIIEGISTGLEAIIEVAPELITTLAQGIIDSIPELLPSLVELITQIAQGLIELLPQLIEVGMQVILELALGIAEALPELIPTIIDVMLQIVDTLIENVDLLVDASIAIIVGLTTGLIEALPKLIEKAPEIIIKLLEALVKNAPKILEAGVELIKQIITGLTKAIPQLIAEIPKLVTDIVTKFKELIDKFKDIGSNIVDGIKKGITEKWSNLTEKVSELGGKLVKKLKSKLGINSPSRVMRDQVGQFLPAGVAVGIKENEGVLTDAVEDMTANAMLACKAGWDSDALSPDFMANGVNASASAMARNASGGLSYGSNQANVNSNVNVVLEGDARGVFKLVRTENNAYMQANGGRTAFA